jgi:hypothetical protein
MIHEIVNLEISIVVDLHVEVFHDLVGIEIPVDLVMRVVEEDIKDKILPRIDVEMILLEEKVLRILLQEAMTATNLHFQSHGAIGRNPEMLRAASEQDQKG